MNYSFLIAALQSTASQGKELGTKPTVRLRLKGPNCGDLGNGLA